MLAPGRGGGQSEGLGEPGEEQEDDASGSYSDYDGGRLLGATYDGDSLARTLVDTQVANELGLVRTEVRRLRTKIAALEREKDDMAEDFRNTTKILLNRIKELEAELSGAQTRPQTAAVIERIEGPAAGRSMARPPLPQRGAQVLRIDEEASPTASSPSRGPRAASPAAGPRAASPSPSASPSPGGGASDAGSPLDGVAGETSVCGNCRRSIPAGNVLAHSVSCYRNNFHCDSCGEVVPLRDKESHQREWTDPERLLDSVGRRDMETVQRMLGHGVDVCAAVHPRTRDTVMHAAARLGDEELIAFFTAHGVEIDPLNEQGETPLHLAASGASATSGAGVAPAVRLLVELGSGLNTTDSRGESPLTLLCRRGAAQTAKFLLEMRADPEVSTKLGDTPLQIAQRNGHQETVLALCTAGAPLRSGTPSRGERRERSGSPLPVASRPLPAREPPLPGPPGQAGYPPRPKGAAPPGAAGAHLRRSLSGSRRSLSASGRAASGGASPAASRRLQA